MPDAAIEHRMSNPVVRRRVAGLAAALLALVWVIVSVAGSAGGPFSNTELSHLSGIPVPPPQIESRFKPQQDPVQDFTNQFQDLRDRVAAVPDALEPAK